MRCYDGCPDSELQALLDANNALLVAVKKLEPEAHCTYFPSEERFQVHKWGTPISGFLASRNAALRDALEHLS